MKPYILLAALFFTSFQIQGTENKKDENTQAQSTAYVAAVRQLIDLSTHFMKELDVNGTDYSNLVNPKIRKVGSIMDKVEKLLYMHFKDCLKAIRVYYSEKSDKLAKQQKLKSHSPGSSLSEQSVLDELKLREEEAIRLLRSNFGTARNEIDDFYKEPLECLNKRNDIYVWLYFSLSDLKEALGAPLDENNPQSILAHFQRVNICLADLSNTLVETRAEGELAFLGYAITFNQTIRLFRTLYSFQHSISAEFLTEELIKNFKPVVSNLMTISRSI